MRVLIFTDSYWPRVNGLSVAVDGIADAVRDRGHTIMVVTPRYTKAQERAAQGQQPKARGTKDKAAYPDLATMPTGIPPGKEATTRDAPARGASAVVPAPQSVISLTGPAPRPVRGPNRVLRISSITSGFSDEDRICLTNGRNLLWQTLDEFKADVVHVQSEFSVGGLGRRYARARGIPLVATCHTDWEDYIRFYMPFLPEGFARMVARTYLRNAYRRDPVITVPTKPMMEMFGRYGFRKRLRLMPSGVDTARFSSTADHLEAAKGELVCRFPRLAKGPILLFAGRVVKEKNLRFLLQAFQRILRARPDASLLVVGDGAYRAEMERDIRELGLSHAVCIYGYTPYERMPTFYRLADVFVFPSLTETQGLVTVESMLCGTPVVAIGAMGTLDVMGGDNGGFMVREDEEEFAARTLELINNPALHAAKRAEALERGMCCAAGTAMDRFVDLYEEVGGHQGTPGD